MAFLKRYGFLIYPLMYWFVYLTLRYLLTKSPDQSTEEFHTALRRELVFIICSLGVYYFLCVSVTGYYEVLRLGILSTLIIHSALLIITLLVSLWNGKIVIGEVIFAQLMAAKIILFFMPFALFYYRER
ncbi:hypothetical protein RFG39_004991 [Klebsiella aerogenes]|nr:hypothetical protein [Klebsiella aerogenes]